MTKKLIILFSSAVISCAAFSLLSLQAHAGSLTTENATTFAKCLPSLNTLGTELMSDPETAAVFDGKTSGPVEDGKIYIYSKPMAGLKSVSPASYDKMEKLVQKCGFNSAEDFATIGDQTMAAYMVHTIGPDLAKHMDQMAQIPAELLAQMPPEAKQGFAMIQALENVPQEDVAALTPEVIALIDKSAEEGPTIGPDFSKFGQ